MWSWERNTPLRIMRTISAGVTSLTVMPGSGLKPLARSPAATKKLWMRLLSRPVQAEFSPSACTARAVKPVSSRSSRRQPSAGSSPGSTRPAGRSEEHTSELQSHHDLVCRLLLEKKKKKQQNLEIKIKKKIKKQT